MHDRMHDGTRGRWENGATSFLLSSNRTSFGATGGNNGLGFRVASLSSDAPAAVPEPSMMVIGTLFGLGGLIVKRRMKK